jgi:hypothetical protein
MSPHAPEAGPAPRVDAASIALRLAQRAFATLVDSRDADELDDARRCAASRRTLSALSADDRLRLGEWLALVIATRDAANRERLMARLGRVGRSIVAEVGRALRRVPADGAGTSFAVAPSTARRAR